MTRLATDGEDVINVHGKPMTHREIIARLRENAGSEETEDGVAGSPPPLTAVERFLSWFRIR